MFEKKRKRSLSAGFNDFHCEPCAENTSFDAFAKHLGVRYIFAETSFANPED
ncbi:hypothetical protein VB713_15480 [Anabaena cylindrica UHCC 0172]|nr:hypothetical protein [Anabaena cylindrica UHCC 0172]